MYWLDSRGGWCSDTIQGRHTIGCYKPAIDMIERIAGATYKSYAWALARLSGDSPFFQWNPKRGGGAMRPWSCPPRLHMLDARMAGYPPTQEGGNPRAKRVRHPPIPLGRLRMAAAYLKGFLTFPPSPQIEWRLNGGGWRKSGWSW